MVDGQGPDAHAKAVSEAAHGDLTGNHAIPFYGPEGASKPGGSTAVVSNASTDKITYTLDDLAPNLALLQSQIDDAKQELGGKNAPNIAAAQSILDNVKQPLQAGGTISHLQWLNLQNNVQLNTEKPVAQQEKLMGFQKQQADLKEAQNKAANSALPKDSSDAQARVTAAAQAYRANPTADTKQALLNANEQLKNLRTLEVSKQYSDAMAKVQAQRALDDKDLDVVANAVASDPNSLTRLNDVASLKGSERLRLYAKIKGINPQFDPGVVQNKVKFLGEFTDPNGKTMNNIDSFNTFLQHAGNLMDVTANFRTTNVPAMNTPFNKLRNAYGDATYTTFKAALEPVRTEYTNFLKAGFAPQAEDIKAGETIMSDNASPAQVEAAVKQFGHTALARAYSVNQKFKTVMGTDYPNLLTPEAKDAAEKVGLGQLVNKFGSGGQIGKPGSGTPSPAPAGATMKVPGSDGKMHWSDGKQDLGVVQ
jgi:hypothetical protein